MMKRGFRVVSVDVSGAPGVSGIFRGVPKVFLLISGALYGFTSGFNNVPGYFGAVQRFSTGSKHCKSVSWGPRDFQKGQSFYKGFQAFSEELQERFWIFLLP